MYGGADRSPRLEPRLKPAALTLHPNHRLYFLVAGWVRCVSAPRRINYSSGCGTRSKWGTCHLSSVHGCNPMGDAMVHVAMMVQVAMVNAGAAGTGIFLGEGVS
jgi:hypothetical protein